MSNTTHTDNWAGRAACDGKPIEFFFGVTDRFGIDRHDPVVLAEGRRLCARCEVQAECLDQALAGGRDVFGLWGGTTKREREALLRYIRRAKCPVCTSEHLRGDSVRQFCLDCGVSWPTVCPSAQARASTDVAA